MKKDPAMKMKKKDAAMKKTDAKKTFKELRQVKLGDKGKTATGKDAGVVELEPQARPI